jgi:hypothetical protein
MPNINMDCWQEKKNKLKEKFPHLKDPGLDSEVADVEQVISFILKMERL